jgi:hypothetical protein
MISLIHIDKRYIIVFVENRNSTTKAPFGCQIFWQNATVAFSLLFDKYCPIMV